ncbi:MAG: 3-hydroxyacyl-CoA dehydrogenase NAD-binding domain-containing protein [Desulfobacteraceae bacterium]|nr:3-hydroxyacyl-CoA dehydrogenase NAD-binding domain-containing protein [Desulfobacteraceae bacterium]
MVRRIKQAAVIGSGIMGGGIAALLAGAGIKTLLLDIVPFDLKEEEKKNPKARNKIVTAGMEAALKAKPPLFLDKKNDPALISTGNLEDDFDKLKECDWIVEVVVENLKIKQQLFKRIDAIRSENTIVSSNTSGIPLKEMSQGLSAGFKKHFLGTHFFNPVRWMHLLEIIPGQETDREILEFMAAFGEKKLGKGIVWAKDTPNFIGNRIGVYGSCRTMQYMLEDGLTIPEVDALFGPAIGRPKTAVFKTSDLVGLDTAAHVATNTYNLVTNDEERDAFILPDFMKKLIADGKLGNKTKAGFYTKELTPEWKTIRKVINPKTGAYETYDKVSFPCIEAAKKAKTLPEKLKAVTYGDDKGAKFAWKCTASQLIYSTNRIPEIADTIVEIDNAMKWGYGFEMGPFESWDAIGLKESVKKMEQDGFKVPEKIKSMLAAGNETFYKLQNGKRLYYDFASKSYKEIKTSKENIILSDLRAAGKVVKTSDSASLFDLGDGVFNIEFHTKMNAMNRSIVDFMAEASEYVYKNGVGIVFGNQTPGMPGTFSAGGDLDFMLGLAKAGKFDEINAFIKKVHEGIMTMKYAPIPSVAAAYGLALGGGCEICLAASRIVAHADLVMGLVEIGAGLVPGGCGMMHLWQRYMDSVPANATIQDYGAYLVPAFLNVAQAKTSMSAQEARAMGFLRPSDRIVFNKDNLIGEAKKEVLRLAEDGYTPPAKKKYPVMGQAAQGMVWAQMNDMKNGGYIPPHMEFIAKKAIYCMSGGEATQGQLVSEEYLMKLEREAFVDLWKTESTQKMAENIMKTGKPLFI